MKDLEKTLRRLEELLDRCDDKILIFYDEGGDANLIVGVNVACGTVHLAGDITVNVADEYETLECFKENIDCFTKDDHIDW